MAFLSLVRRKNSGHTKAQGYDARLRPGFISFCIQGVETSSSSRFCPWGEHDVRLRTQAISGQKILQNGRSPASVSAFQEANLPNSPGGWKQKSLQLCSAPCTGRDLTASPPSTTYTFHAGRGNETPTLSGHPKKGFSLGHPNTLKPCARVFRSISGRSRKRNTSLCRSEKCFSFSVTEPRSIQAAMLLIGDQPTVRL